MKIYSAKKILKKSLEILQKISLQNNYAGKEN